MNSPLFVQTVERIVDLINDEALLDWRLEKEYWMPKFAIILREYGEACVLDAFDNKWKYEHKRCLEIEHMKALEEAAKVSESLPLKIFPHPGEQIANQIRALQGGTEMSELTHLGYITQIESLRSRLALSREGLKKMRCLCQKPHDKNKPSNNQECPWYIAQQILVALDGTAAGK